jgi:acyl phosphate:glycerol-3-phosphate acyltransferase
MHSALIALLTVLAAYLIGSLSFAVIAAKLMGLPDPRSFGSGNPGATNVLRTGNKTAALLTLLGDLAKGWVAVWLAGKIGSHFGNHLLVVHVAALSVFLGHLYPVFFGFSGGKGVATALGVLLAFNPMLGLAALATWLIVFAVSRLSSLAALAAAAAVPIYGAYLTASRATVITLCILSALLVWRHRGNIQRLLAGKESGFRKSR